MLIGGTGGPRRRSMLLRLRRGRLGFLARRRRPFGVRGSGRCGDTHHVAGGERVRRAVDEPLGERQSGQHLDLGAEIAPDRDRLELDAVARPDNGDFHAAFAEHQRARRDAHHVGIARQLEIGLRIAGVGEGAAGEGGHVTIDANGPKCGCGKRGCIEVYASGTAVARQARERIAENPVAGARMFAMAGCSLDLVTAEIVSEAAAENDVLANDILHHAADSLAIWLGGIVDLLEPEVIVIGGGFGRVMMRYAPRMREKLKVWAINPNRKRVKIASARFRGQSALVGAAALWLAQPGK